MKELAKKLLSNIGISVSKLGSKNDIDLYLQIYGEESVRDKRFYNVSAGGHYGFGCGFDHPLWTHLDFKRPILKEYRQFNPSQDIEYNMLEKDKLPIEANSAEIIYSQYSIEHVPDDCADFLFSEAYNSLKKGGVLKIVTPNTDLDYLALINNDRSFFSWMRWYGKSMGFKDVMTKASLEQIFISHFAANASEWHIGGNPNQITDLELTKMVTKLKKDELFEFCTSRCSVEIQKQHRDNHINWWTHKKLKDKLTAAGFDEIYFLIPYQSSTPVLRNNRYFDYWNQVALFVEAIKK